jgi:hypothetical protein
MVALHHALLGASVVALVVAGVRLASPLAPDGAGRAIAAATFAVAAAVGEALALGLVGLGGSTVALALAALLTGAVAVGLLPRPAVPVGRELADAWRRTTVSERAGLGAVAGFGLAWAAWQLRHPAVGFDAIHYHLPEMVLFVQGGHPGSVHDVLPGLPVGNYPLTTEVTIAWAMGIARSFVPLILWPWLTLSLTSASAWAGLRALGVPRLARGLAAAALCTSPWLLAWQSNGSVTDPPALAWLTACAALCAMSRARPALLVPAVVAGGLAIGCKTTVLPFTLAVLAIALFWGGRARLRALPRGRELGLALAGALVVGGVWYLRNLVTHGSPFWPIVATPWGDPVPASVAAIHASFLDRPRATIDVIGHAYLARFGGGLLLLGCGVLLAPLVAPRRRVLAAAGVTAAGLLLWARTPITGLGTGPASLPETVFSTTRYTLPMVGAACVALALAGAVESRRRVVALVALAAAVVVNVVQTLRLGYPVAPSALVPLVGALAGACSGALVAALAARVPALPGRARPAVVAAAAVAACALLAVPAGGFLSRHAALGGGVEAQIARRLAADRVFERGSAPVATTPAFIGPLAGDRLRHRLVAIPPGSSCAAIAPRARHQWLVIYGGPLGGVAPAAVRRCLPPPAFELREAAIYAPGR